MTCTYRETCVEQPDFLATIDLNPRSPCYCQVPVSLQRLPGMVPSCWLCASWCLGIRDLSSFLLGTPGCLIATPGWQASLYAWHLLVLGIFLSCPPFSPAAWSCPAKTHLGNPW